MCNVDQMCISLVFLVQFTRCDKKYSEEFYYAQSNKLTNLDKSLPRYSTWLAMQLSQCWFHDWKYSWKTSFGRAFHCSSTVLLAQCLLLERAFSRLVLDPQSKVDVFTQEFLSQSKTLGSKARWSTGRRRNKEGSYWFIFLGTLWFLFEIRHIRLHYFLSRSLLTSHNLLKLDLMYNFRWIYRS